MRSISPYQLPLFVEQQCTRCGVVQWLDNFPLDPRVPGRHKTWCKACCGAYRREWSARNKERLAERRASIGSPEKTPPPSACKQCLKCALTKWLGDFPVDPRYRDGHRSWCKGCTRAYEKEWYARNWERLRARSPEPTPSEKRYSRCGVIKPASAFQDEWARRGRLKSQCKECHAASENARRDRDRAAYNAWAKRRRQANPEPGRDYSRRYAQAHPEKVSAYLAQWRREHQEWVKNYCATHREEAKVQAHKRRALKRNAGGTHTKADLDAIFTAQAGQCAYCGITLVKPIHVDHKIPLSRGGSNGPENLCLSCAHCNLEKHTKTDVEYRAWLAHRAACLSIEQPNAPAPSPAVQADEGSDTPGREGGGGG